MFNGESCYADDDFHASCTHLSVYFFLAYVFRIYTEKPGSALNFFNPEFFLTGDFWN